jgi:hypothetical protein
MSTFIAKALFILMSLDPRPYGSGNRSASVQVNANIVSVINIDSNMDEQMATWKVLANIAYRTSLSNESYGPTVNGAQSYSLPLQNTNILTITPLTI